MMPAVIKLLAGIFLELCIISLSANGQFSPPFRFDGFPSSPESTRSSFTATSNGELPPPSPPPPTSSLNSGNSNSNNNSASQPLIWQPLRASFRPLNRQVSPPPPPPPAAPTPPAPPVPPVPLALSLGTEPISSSSSSISSSDFSSDLGDTRRLSSRFDGGASSRSGDPSSSSSLSSLATTNTNFAADSDSSGIVGNGDTFVATPPSTSSLNPTPAPSSIARDNLDNEDLPTRVPLNRFRPTKPPSNDPQTNQPTPATPTTAAAAVVVATIPATSRSNNNFTISSSFNNNNRGTGRQTIRNHHITSECLECICEASTNCNPNSRCQTSDVRHTRCGMFLISYDQWLDTGLSKELVSSEALAQDAAADERAFYECVTNRDCAERLLTIYAQRNAKDCDKDGRIDCYDMAAVHQGGLDGCQSESLLDSQYWNDFNACFGFGR